MAKSSSKQKNATEKKSSPMIYGIVILMAGALLGVAFSTAFQSTSGQNAVPPQFQNGDLFSQIKIYSDRVAANPQDVDAWVTLGNLYFDTDQPAKSVEAYRRSLEINPNNPNVLTDMGVMHRKLREYQKALDAFAKAIEVNPEHETARMNAGVVMLYDLGDKQGAIRAWGDLVAMNPQARNAEGTLISDILKEMTGAEQSAQSAEKKLLAPLSGATK